MARRKIDRWETPPGWKSADGCTILGCGRPGIARGMCWNHYQRARRGLPVYVLLRQVGRNAVVTKLGPAKPTYSFLRANRIKWELETNVTWEPNTGCALWLGDYNPSTGRPQIGNSHDPWARLAARAVLYFAGVRIEKGHRGMHVRHLCDNGACVNPRHLVYGTAKENTADTMRRFKREGRTWGAWLKPRSRKMDESQIAYAVAAHDAGMSYADIARELGVSWSTVRARVLETPIHNQNSPQAA